MIKCPNCGSSAQVELVWVDGEMYSNTHYKQYKCGCGCDFVITFEITDIKIIPKEEESI